MALVLLAMRPLRRQSQAAKQRRRASVRAFRASIRRANEAEEANDDDDDDDDDEQQQQQEEEEDDDDEQQQQQEEEDDDDDVVVDDDDQPNRRGTQAHELHNIITGLASPRAPRKASRGRPPAAGF